MQFSRSFLLALFSAIAYAQTSTDGPNSFTYNLNEPFSVTAGEPVDITWNPTTGGTVTLILRQGASSNLSEGTVIASNIDNSGSYTWTPAADTVRGSDYALQIVDDQDTTQVNYSPPFVLESDNTVASTTNIATLAAPTSSPSLGSTLTPTASPSAFPTTTGTESTTTMTGTSTTSETSSGSMSETSAGDLQAASTSMAGGARATAMAGMLGFVALGAMAL